MCDTPFFVSEKKTMIFHESNLVVLYSNEIRLCIVGHALFCYSIIFTKLLLPPHNNVKVFLKRKDSTVGRDIAWKFRQSTEFT